MIVSMAMAVLPVCRSPMISSRWPPSIGLIPVCSGSFTFCRCTTEGACTSRARSCVPSISPLPSRGIPSGSTTRPRKPSPTGTDSTSPVRRTCWPSSILLKSPRMTTPISRTSRLSARPRMPPGNSSSSFAMAEGSPSTRAMPSPHSATVPTSSLEAASGWYAWTKLASASRISSGRIVSSAMVLASLSLSVLLVCRYAGGLSLCRSPWFRPVLCAPASSRQAAPQLGQAARHAAVDKLIPDPDGHTTYEVRIDDHIEVDLMPVRGRKDGGQPIALLRAERDGHPDNCDQALPPLRRQPGVLGQACIQATSPGMHGRLADQVPCVRRRPALKERVKQAALVLCRNIGTGQDGAQLRRTRDHPAEPEQLVLQVVEVAPALGRGRDGEHRKLLNRVGQVSRA